MTQSYRAFLCQDPDFTVRSIPDGDIFNVKKECLIKGSEVFRRSPSSRMNRHDLLITACVRLVNPLGDMFSCCDAGFQMINVFDEETQTLDLQESAVALNALFSLLHSPPPLFVAPPPALKDFTRILETVPEATIPCPLLPALFVLADKYALSRELVQILKSHLAACASTFPLSVYGCAVGRGLNEVAAEASAHLLHPPLTSYTPEEIKIIPTAEAYHQLVLLHDFRIKQLGKVLVNEEIFPHGYGECSRHAQRTKSIWQQRKTVVSSKIQAGEHQIVYLSI